METEPLAEACGPKWHEQLRHAHPKRGTIGTQTAVAPGIASGLGVSMPTIEPNHQAGRPAPSRARLCFALHNAATRIG
jgi:hypothetical protein